MTIWQRTIPIVPARDIDATDAFYRDRLDFDIIHTANDYGIVRRGPVEIRLWGPSDIDPAEQRHHAPRPGRHDDISTSTPPTRTADSSTPNAPLRNEPWGTREFAIRDLDGNLITFSRATRNGQLTLRATAPV